MDIYVHIRESRRAQTDSRLSEALNAALTAEAGQKNSPFPDPSALFFKSTTNLRHFLRQFFETSPPSPPIFRDKKKNPESIDIPTDSGLFFGGEHGIRTHEPLLTVTRFPVVLLRPARTTLQKPLLLYPTDPKKSSVFSKNFSDYEIITHSATQALHQWCFCRSRYRD